MVEEHDNRPYQQEQNQEKRDNTDISTGSVVVGDTNTHSTKKEPNTTNTATAHRQNDVHAARKGLIKAIWQTSVAPRFSSRPIDMEDYFSDRGSIFNSSINMSGSMESTTHGADASTIETAERFRTSLHESSNLTKSEQYYLHKLLKSDNLESIRRASIRLADKELFPTDADLEDEDDEDEEQQTTTTKTKTVPSSQKTQHTRRNSQVQQKLFQLHEKTTILPSAILKRMTCKASRPLFISHSNSIMVDNESEPVLTMDTQEEKSSKDDKTRNDSARKWNPFKDLNSWIDGSEGVEVDDEGKPEITSPTSNPFKILGTSADDTSCHPHVLSPPLMEGLQLFMPESLHEQHYWLKYSLVRDGPGLLKMIRHCRASPHTVLAIETTDGHVFGSFTSQPWRLATRGYYGSTESFVWRMRRSRNEAVKSVMEQILMESQIDVFPYTGTNKNVQLCTADNIALGHGEVKDGIVGTSKDQDDQPLVSDHYGFAIKLDKSMARGTTSSSETFGNPCLIHRESRGEAFEVANVELWSLTPHDTVEEADQDEMKSLFEENRHTNNNLNIIDILVGGTNI
jgi:hypothetical protein